MTEWDLPEQPLAKSLREIAAQTDSNIIFDKKLVNEQSAPPLKMKATTEQALKQVLEGTGLTYRHLDDKTVTIQLASTDPSITTSASYGADGRIRLAQAETGDTGRRTRMVEGKPLLDIEEIIVTGTNIRGVENKTAPVLVLSREYINSTGFSTTTKLIESLPQNFALANQSGLQSNGTGQVSSAFEQGSSINLRGIGEGTTLVLLNGRRLAPGFKSAAADISALPLTAIERVEILTDGASAIYGSDAVGGVVNFILRDDFEGAETRLRAGFADGTDEYRVSQALGNSWDSGNVLLSLEYYQRDELLTSDRDYIPANVAAPGLLPEEENYSAVFTGEQQLSGSITAFADVLFSQRDSFNRAGRVTPLFNETPNNVDNPQLNATLGLNFALGGDWQLELSGSFGSNDLEVVRGGGTLGQASFDSKFESEAGRVKADGTVLGLPGGNMRMAIGADYRSETYEDMNALGGMLISSTDTDQDVSSAFAELYIPLVGDPNAVAGVQRLEVSLAGRYDDYSSFGSSFDPQYGLMWEPVGGLRLRARYGTSYKAPNLIEYSFGTNSGAAVLAQDPLAPGGFNYQLQVSGIDVNGLQPQESTSSSFGLEFTPEAVKGLAVNLNYYQIRYRNRITNPPLPSVTLGDAASFGSLFIRNPTVDQVNQFIAIAQLGPVGFIPLSPIDFTFDPNFDPASIDVIVDGRRRNLSLVDTNGVDFSTRYDFGVGSSNVALGIDATYVLQIEQQITTTSAPFETDDTFGNAPNLRMRAMASWQRGGWSTNAFVNYTDSYTDNRLMIPVSVDAYTTVDARVAYSFSNRFSSGFLSGVTVGASVLNLLDEDPPSTQVISPPGSPGFDLGFDPTNASPLGRFIALEFTKTW
ncbi:TonB-dependent receptor [Peristeroidobacter agariperforans]|uniref:TonB-dependent receptor n=1 Tax=Peristeroidobacter agariperforans TaxID=268404 RepID=UPI0018E583A3|nr:TonB-dependent receptor [Peristeroidobacter agariperforans]